MKTYASIHIGSYGISLKVFEITLSKSVRQLDEMRRNMDLAGDIIRFGKISREQFLLILDVLSDMKQTITTYRCDDYDVYIGNALLSAENIETLIDRIRIACQMHALILDNSRQRFLLYKALCYRKNFRELMERRTVLVDIGGGGMQLTLFGGGKLITTQHIYLGTANVWETLRKLRQSVDYREELLEMLYLEIEAFYNSFLDEKPPQNLVIINNPIVSIKKARAKKRDGHFTAKEYMKIIQKTLKLNAVAVSEEEVTEDTGDIRLSFLLMYRSVIEQIPVEEVFVPPVSLHEGMVYEYAHNHKLLPLPRDFDEDVIEASWAIARRYHSHVRHLQTLLSLSRKLFDALGRWHGMSGRERLLLSVAVILHDCGKYISLSNEAECTYTIITSTEILGLSDLERMMIACICYYYKEEGRACEKISGHFSKEDSFTLQKLYAIMNLAGSLDQRYTYSFKDVRFRLQGREELSVVIDTQDSLALEKGIFKEKAAVFEDVFAIRPVLKTVRIRRGGHEV